MNFRYANRKLEKTVSSQKIEKAYGAACAKKIMQRLAEIEASETLAVLSSLPGPRCHQLVGNRREQFAVDLKHPTRMIIEPDHNPVPKREDGGFDLKRIKKIVIVEITDYH